MSDTPSIPLHLAGRQTVGGLVVPYISLQHRNGAAVLGLVDADRMAHCLTDRLCGICGHPLWPGRYVFLMRDMDIARGLSFEPGLCPPCAVYTQSACPMIAGRLDSYRRSPAAFVERHCGDPDCPCLYWYSNPESARHGAPAHSWRALWIRSYTLGRDSASGLLIADFRSHRVLAVRRIGDISGPEA